MFIYELVGEEDVDCLCELFFLRFFQHIERYDVFDAESFEFQYKVAEIYSQYLGRKPIWHSVEPCLLIGPEALSIRDPAGPSRSLIGAALAAGHHDHLIDACLPIEHLDLHIPAIHHILHLWNSNRTLCDICSQDYLSIVTPLEDEVLILRAHLGVQRQHLQSSLVFHHIGIQHMRHALNLLYRGQKNQDLAGWFFSIDVDDGLKHLQKIIFGGVFEVMNGNLMQPTCYIDRFYA